MMLALSILMLSFPSLSLANDEGSMADESITTSIPSDEETVVEEEPAPTYYPGTEDSGSSDE